MHNDMDMETKRSKRRKGGREGWRVVKDIVEN